MQHAQFQLQQQRGRHELTHLRKQRLPVVPTPTVQGLPRQLVAQVVSRLDSSSSQHTSRLKVSPCIMLDHTFVKIECKYDNVWGYSCRAVDLVRHMANEDAMAGCEAPAAAGKIRA